MSRNGRNWNELQSFLQNHSDKTLYYFINGSMSGSFFTSNNLPKITKYFPFKILLLKPIKIYLFKQKDLKINSDDVEILKNFLNAIPEKYYSIPKRYVIHLVCRALINGADLYFI